MQTDNKTNIVYTKEDGRPSRFLVDLQVTEDTEQSQEKNQRQKIKDKVFQFKKELCFKKIIKISANNFKYKYKQLTIFPLFSIIHKLSYYTGWLAVFLLKFVYLLSKKIIFGGIALEAKFRQQRIEYKISKQNLKKEKFPLGVETIKLEEERDNFDSTSIMQIDPGSLEQTEEKKQKFTFRKIFPRPRISLLRPVLYFTLTLSLLILPLKGIIAIGSVLDLKGRVLGVSETAINEFLSGAALSGELDFSKAEESFSLAGESFLKAKKELDAIDNLLGIIAPLTTSAKIKLASKGQEFLEMAELTARIAARISAGLKVLTNDTDFNTKIAIDSLCLELEQAKLEALNLRILLKEINIDNFPLEYQEALTLIKNKAILVTAVVEDSYNLLDLSRIILGFEDDKRYLLVFQNNSELRASGGFIGSYALIDFRNGAIKNLEVPGGGSYDTEAGLKEKIIAPAPLHLVNPLWHFWDANWWPDWPKTAQKLEWFYEKSDGPTVDGVISLTPTIVEDFLEIIGPIDLMAEYGVMIDHENFWQIVQDQAEQKPAVTVTPKLIIGTLMEKLFAKAPKQMNKTNLLKLIKVLESNLISKQILLYFNDENVERRINANNWAGEIKTTQGDYLMVVNTNIAGAKTDRVINDTVSHQSSIASDGTIINTVTIKRIHSGIKGDAYTGVRNVNWLRAYVPLGSQLIFASGFESPDKSYFEEPNDYWQTDPDVSSEEDTAELDTNTGTKIYVDSGKTVFANWTQVDPGQSITITIKYRLPFKLNLNQDLNKDSGNFLNPLQSALVSYSLLVQKQAGAKAFSFSSLVDLPNNLKIETKYGDNLNINANTWQINDSLNNDKFWAVITSVIP